MVFGRHPDHPIARAALAVLLSAPLALITACGGGGGGGDAPANNPPPAAAVPLVLSVDNERVVAADALDTVTFADSAAAGGALITGVQVSAVAPGGALQLAAVARTLADLARPAASLATGVTVNDTQPCTAGGTMRVTGTVSGADQLVAGDAVTLFATDCVESVDGVRTVVNGAMTLVVRSVGVPGAIPNRVVIAVTTSNFSVAADGRSSVSNGDMLMELTQTGTGSGSMVLSGSSLSNATTTPAGIRVFTLKDYRQSITPGGENTLFALDGTVESTNGRLGSTPVRYQVLTRSPVTVNSAGSYLAGDLRLSDEKGWLDVQVRDVNIIALMLDVDRNSFWESNILVNAAELR